VRAESCRRPRGRRRRGPSGRRPPCSGVRHGMPPLTRGRTGPGATRHRSVSAPVPG
jgi:hypothetical protein